MQAQWRHVLLGCAVAGLAASPDWRSVPVVALLAFTALVGLRGGVELATGAGLVVLAAGVVGDARIKHLDAMPLADLAGRRADVRGHVVARPRLRDGERWEIRARVAAEPGGDRQLTQLEGRGRPPAVEIGDELAARGVATRVAGPAGETGSSSDAYARHLQREGVRLRMRGHAWPTGRRRGGLAGFVDSIRRRSDRAMALGLPRELSALLRGMVLGGDAGLSRATVDDFRVTGLSHILAVSGANVLLLVVLVQAIAAAFGLGRLVRIVVPALLVLLYVPLCGAQPSVLRAGVMGLAGLAALAASRPRTRWYAMLLAAAVLLAWNPRATADVGAQLSFAAVAGIALFASTIGARLGRLPRWLAEAASVTVAATIATAPLTAFHFGTVSLVSLVSNVVAAPLIGPIVWLGSLSAAFGQFAPAVSALLNGANIFLLAALAALAKALAQVPFAQVRWDGFGAEWLAGSVIVTALAALWLHRARGAPVSRRRTARAGMPVTLAGAERQYRAALALAGVLTCLAALAAKGPSGGDRPLAVQRPAVVFLDVGQGDAVLLLGRDGCEALIDGGPPGAGLAGKLRAYGVRSLELAVATHAQNDHHGGLAELARASKPRVTGLLDGGGPAVPPDFERMRGVLRAARARIATGVAGTGWQCGRDLALEVVGPAPLAPGRRPPDDPNVRALVIEATVGRLRLLTSGDAESPQLLRLPLRHADVFKVPHHGSRDDGLARVLERVDPEAAVVCVGRGNRYGHPAATTLRALESVDRVARTDVNGDVAVSPGARGEGVKIQVERTGEGGM